MQVSELKVHMENKYDLIVFEDLADFVQKHSAIFKLFKQLSRDYFEKNERLVFYTEHNLETEFLEHIQRAASKLDIPNFFIIVVTPTDIQKQLSSANLKFGYDDVAISNYVLDICDTKSFPARGFVPIDNACPYAFGGFHLQENFITACCNIKQFPRENTNNTFIDDFNHPRLRKLRQDMVDGKRSSECSACWEKEDQNLSSIRKSALLQFEDRLDFDWADDACVRELMWQPSKLCNFKCRICRPNLSSLIAAEEVKYTKDPRRLAVLKNYLDVKTDLPKQRQTIENLKNLDKLEIVHLTGGEPLIWPLLDEFLDTLIANKQAPDITLFFHTNISTYPGDTITKIRNNFKSLNFSLSIDNIGERFELERGSNWSNIVENINKFAELCTHGIKVDLGCSIGIQNALYLDELFEFSKTIGIPINWSYVKSKPGLSIYDGTTYFNKLVYEKYKDSEVHEFREIAKLVKDLPGTDGKKFITYTNELDKRRGQDFSKTHPEVYEAMCINTLL